MVTIPTKWDRFGTSIFTVMTQKAISAGAVNLAQGFPDFDGPDVVKEAAIAAIKNGLNQYAPAVGLAELRQLLAKRQRERTGLDYDETSEVTVFSGATEAIYCAFQAFFEPGDEIIALEPYYDSYPAAAFAAGARLVGVPLVAPRWRFSVADLEQAVTPRTKALIINTPHNPTGRVLDDDELAAIRAVVLKHQLLLITDEVYEELVYAPHQHISPSTLPGMKERTVVISSTSKTFSMTGWKIGYAFAPAKLMAAMRTVHQFTVFCSATPLQAGMIAALRLGDDYFDNFRTSYRTRRDLLAKILREAGFKLNEAEGTYFMLADYSDVSDQHDQDFAVWLTEQVKVAAIPISGFHTDASAAAKRLRYLRFGFCKGEATLKAAAACFTAHLGRS